MMAPGAITTLVATEVRLFREGLAESLKARAGLRVVETASTSRTAIDRLARHRPRIMLLDPQMAGSRAVTSWLFETDLETKVIILGLDDAEPDLLRWAEEGISAYVTRQHSIEELIETIRKVDAEAWSCEPQTVTALLRHMARLSHSRGRIEKALPLTRRELEVAELLAQSLTNKEIARHLGISKHTVKSHVHNILSKLQLRRRAQAADWLRSHRRPRRPSARTLRRPSSGE